MTAEQAQGIRDFFVMSMGQEVATTAKVLAAVPNDNRDYKPDPKSRSAWDLATHMAVSDVWFLESIVSGKFARSEGGVPAEMTSPESIAAWYREHLPSRLTALQQMTSQDLLRPVEFFGTSQPAVHWLALANNHSMHHRGQLAGYLRSCGGKVPAIYGPSADENPFA